MNKNFIEIVKAAQDGDNRAFEALYNMTKDSAYFIALSITKNEQDALDIMQDSYIKAFGGISTLDKPEVFDSWIGKIVANTSKNYISRKKPMLFEDMGNEAMGDWNEEEFNKDYLPQESVDSKETSRLLMEIIDRLSEDKRLCILMYYYQDMSVKEISEALELPVTTVKYKLLAARAEIKRGVEDLEKRGTKLYGIFPFALFPAQFKNIETEFCKMYSSPKYSLLNFSVNAAPSQVVATEVTKVVVKKGFFSTVAGKVTAVSVAVILAGSGITAAVVASNSSQKESTQPMVTETVNNADDKNSSNVSETVKRKEARFTSSDGLYICEITNGSIKTIRGDRLRIVGYNEPKTMTDLVVPSTIDGYSVQEIYCNAFLGLENTRSITLPDTINKLHSHAFSDTNYRWNDESQRRNLNPSLKEVILPDNLKEISSNCFRGCASLERVTLPKNLEIIWSGAFGECSSLKNIEFPDTLTRIGPGSFTYCSSITEVCIPKSVKKFYNYVFSNCTSLERVRFEEGFMLEGLSVDADMLYLYSSLVEDIPSMREIYIPESFTGRFDFMKYDYENGGADYTPNYENTKNSNEIEDLKNITFYGKSGSHIEEVITNCGLNFVAVDEDYTF